MGMRIQEKILVNAALPIWETRHLNSKRRKRKECVTSVLQSSKTNKIDEGPSSSTERNSICRTLTHVSGLQVQVCIAGKAIF